MSSAGGAQQRGLGDDELARRPVDLHLHGEEAARMLHLDLEVASRRS